MRTFPEFVGTWVLDEAASPGRLAIVPRIPLRVTITTTPEMISVTAAGQIRIRQDPPNNFRHTYIYRRKTQAAAR